MDFLISVLAFKFGLELFVDIIFLIIFIVIGVVIFVQWLNGKR